MRVEARDLDYPRRILQIVTRPQRRGAEVFAYDLSRRFEELGKAVKTIYLYGYEGESALPLHGEDVCLRGSENHLLERVLGFHPGLLQRVRREIRAFSPDIVQVNGSRSVKYGAAAKQFARGHPSWKLIYRNIGVPSDWHRGEDTVLAYRFMIMPKMDGVIGVSQRSLSDAKSLYRLEGPAEVITNGVSAARLEVMRTSDQVRSELGAREDDFIALFLGHLEEAKRPDRFISVIDQVARRLPNVHGWIVGAGPLEESLREQARRLDLGERIRFLGSRSDVATYLAAANLLLSTSDTEGVPATILEAALMGLPVVATRVGGLAECVIHEETGILVASGSEREMIEAIESLARNPERLQRMGRVARQKASETYTIESVASKYLDFYRSVGAPTLSPAIR